MKNYNIKDYPDIDYIHDEILDTQEIGYKEIFEYNGKTYSAIIEHDCTYMEYGIPGRIVVFKEI